MEGGLTPGGPHLSTPGDPATSRFLGRPAAVGHAVVNSTQTRTTQVFTVDSKSQDRMSEFGLLNTSSNLDL